MAAKKKTAAKKSPKPAPKKRPKVVIKPPVLTESVAAVNLQPLAADPASPASPSNRTDFENQADPFTTDESQGNILGAACMAGLLLVAIVAMVWLLVSYT